MENSEIWKSVLLLRILTVVVTQVAKTKKKKKKTETKHQSPSDAFRRKIDVFQSFRVFHFALYPK